MEKMNATRLVIICFTTVLFACCVRKGDAQDDASNDYDVVIQHGSIIDGTTTHCSASAGGPGRS
jgi:hypothetical protein